MPKTGAFHCLFLTILVFQSYSILSCNSKKQTFYRPDTIRVAETAALKGVLQYSQYKKTSDNVTIMNCRHNYNHCHRLAVVMCVCYQNDLKTDFYVIWRTSKPCTTKEFIKFWKWCGIYHGWFILFIYSLESTDVTVKSGKSVVHAIHGQFKLLYLLFAGNTAPISDVNSRAI